MGAARPRCHSSTGSRGTAAWMLRCTLQMAMSLCGRHRGTNLGCPSSIKVHCCTPSCAVPGKRPVQQLIYKCLVNRDLFTGHWNWWWLKNVQQELNPRENQANDLSFGQANHSSAVLFLMTDPSNKMTWMKWLTKHSTSPPAFCCFVPATSTSSLAANPPFLQTPFFPSACFYCYLVSILLHLLCKPFTLRPRQPALLRHPARAIWWLGTSGSHWSFWAHPHISPILIAAASVASLRDNIHKAEVISNLCSPHIRKAQIYSTMPIIILSLFSLQGKNVLDKCLKSGLSHFLTDVKKSDSSVLTEI